MRYVMARAIVVLATLVGVVVPVAVSAQSYPTKPIRLILPFPPGGPTDILGRLTGQKLGELVGQQVIADSRPGASGNVGLELASKAPPDGYTIVHVPYKGSGLALIGLASGQVDLEILAIPPAMPQIQAGRVRPIAVLAPSRSAQLPDVPTATEAGYPNFEISMWYGMLAPAATPSDIVRRLNAELNKAIATPDLKEKFAANGIEPLGGTPEQFRDYIRSESDRFGKVIREAE